VFGSTPGTKHPNVPVPTMIGDFEYTHARWNVPVPVRSSRFVPSHPHLQGFNVEVDLAQLRAFGSLRDAVRDSDLLYVDLQTNSYLDLPGRLGSGRAGFYRGRFLKGVGRTSLAANWNIISDQKRATGHLATSAAVREFIVSCYLRAKGKATTVNGCEGLLVAPLAPALSNHTLYGYDAARCVLPCDVKMQAISVKGSRFARFSNFMWLLNNIDLNSSAQHLREFFKGFVAYLDSPIEESSRPTTPARIAAAFSSAIERSLDNFRAFWKLGINFGSPFNNVTMDGRYQDLQRVVFLGGPFLGVIPRQPIDSFCVGACNPSLIFGLEVLTYIRYVRIFYRFLLSRLTSIPAMELPLSSKEREFIQLTVRELRKQLGRDHILFSLPRLCDRLLLWVREDAGLSGRQLRQAKSLIQGAARLGMCSRSRPSTMNVSLRAVPLRCARPGTYLQFAPPHIVSFCDITSEALAEAQFMHDLLSQIDAADDPERLLMQVCEAERSVAKYCGSGASIARHSLAPPTTVSFGSSS